jgi:hypothetical protein
VTADLVVRLHRTAGDERRAARALLASTAAWCAGAPVGSVTLGRAASGVPLLGGGGMLRQRTAPPRACDARCRVWVTA